jgi:hypothetical protein
MDKLQFLSLLIPSLGSFLLVILAWLHSNGRLDRMEKKLDVIEGDLRTFYKDIGRIEGRIDEMARSK